MQICFEDLIINHPSPEPDLDNRESDNKNVLKRITFEYYWVQFVYIFFDPPVCIDGSTENFGKYWLEGRILTQKSANFDTFSLPFLKFVLVAKFSTAIDL